MVDKEAGKAEMESCVSRENPNMCYQEKILALQHLEIGLGHYS